MGVKKNNNLFWIFIIFFIISSSAHVSADNHHNFESRGEEVAEDFRILLDNSVEDTLEVSKFDFSNIEDAKNNIEAFFNSKTDEIWFNIGTDKVPIEQRKEATIYSEITFIDSEGMEIIKYDGEFSNDLKDISIISNTEFKSETYFEDTKNLSEGEVFIGKVMTWYTPKEEVFQETISGEYEDVIGRDIMKKGVIRFSSPVFSEGEFFGMVVLSLDYSHFQKISKHIDPASEEPVISSQYSGNYLLVFDVDGNTIIHPKPDNIRGYLENGELAGYNEPNSTKEGNIFNLFAYKKSLTYSEIAEKNLIEKEVYISSATDVGGRTKLTVSVPILYSNSKTNYAEQGVFGGIMMSISLEEETPIADPEITQDNYLYYVFGGIILLLIILIFIMFSRFRREEEEKEIIKSKWKDFFFGGISRKFMTIFGILFITIITIGVLIIYFQEQVLEEQFDSSILETKKDYEDLEKESIRSLSSALEVILADESLYS